MRKYIVFIALSFFCLKAASTNIPAVTISTATTVSEPVNPLSYFSSLSMKEVQRLAGRKLKLKEKMAVKFFQWKLKKGLLPLRNEKTSDKGKTAMILGIISIACLAIPYVNIASIPLAILAIIFGNQARKENPNDSKAKAGVILGWVTIALIILALAIAIVVLSAWIGGWG